jgi:enoyl reductase-like protein
LVKGKKTNEFSQVRTNESTEGGGKVERSITEKVKDEEEVVRKVLSRKVVQKLAKKQKSNFSAAVAKVAYNKFGERPMSPANILVTRKWLQKYLEDQFKDLRTCDKNIAIDRALFLSFVPTKDFLNMRVLMETKEMQKRTSDSTWGKIFQLRRGDAPQ